MTATIPFAWGPDGPAATPVRLSRGSLLPMAVVAGLFIAYTEAAGRGSITSLATAAAFGAAGCLVSLLVHELGHVRAAHRAAGVRVVRVVMMALGGATQLEGAYRTGRDQARVAAAGPAASIALAIVFLGSLALPLPLPAEWSLFLLAGLNVLLALVALLPVHPFDGHKVLVGIVWTFVRSETRARKVVRRAGIVLGCGDAAATCVLLAERPLLGLGVVALAASFLVERQLAHALRRRHTA